VRDKSGQVLLNRVLRGGESWAVPDRPALLLTTGNAGGTELLVDGVSAAPLGNDGAVRRDLPLDAEAIRSGRLAPAPRHP
jgi:cytoskeleton protein RodZ